MAIQSRRIVWIDIGARTRVTEPSANPDNSGIMSALQAHSNADVLNWIEGPLNVLTPSAVNAVYANVADIARLTFTDGTSFVDLALLAPKSSIFLADSVTVDSTQITGIITACVGTLVTAAGNPVTSFVAGLRGTRSSGG